MSTYKRKPQPWAKDLEARAQLASQHHQRELARQKQEREQRAIADAMIFLSSPLRPRLRESKRGSRIIWGIVLVCVLLSLYALSQLVWPR
jgi:hypothetical protein